MFGARGGDGCPWHFADGVLQDETYDTRVRIALDAKRRVVHGAMLVGEEAHPTAATQTITQTGPLSDDQLLLHSALIRISATLIDGIGHGRRRGMGWVTVTTDSPSIDDDVDVVMQYAATRKGA